ncbi:DUF1499 domain-containing protein [Marinomonas pollencensis]|uniref:Uncharacterized protein DUF1499 n=1 Tax=Marinomonas pollencensis TaxID=491954 RepID=A0A3E0DRV0_9GAMM|nr:DUF1499 domain-containing protein [Marinomonas pollencensis]REG85875.1 uncharacterized protein DUF1499 [Marinomonas pollencensis]
MSRYISPVLYILLMLVGCAAFISIAGVRVGLFEPITGFSLLRQSVFASLALSAFAALSMFFCRKECNVSSQRFFGLVLTVSLVYSLMWIVFYVERCNLPQINDISTDTVSPPLFINATFLRKSNQNSLDYNPKVAAIQKANYPEVKPVFTDKDIKLAYQKTLKLIQDKGWQLNGSYPEVGIIEATARTPIFGFRDDVVLRVAMVDGKVRIDMRSCSRVGTGDFGMNAKRIVNFMTDLEFSLNSRPMDRVHYLK